MRRRLYGFLGMLLASTVVSCERRTPTGAHPSSSQNRAPVKIGFFAFDGTRVKASDNSIIYRLYRDSNASFKVYKEGTDIVASTYASIVKEGLNEVCEAFRAGRFEEAFFVGYSAGGIAALEIAARTQEHCGEKVPIRWIGLLDAVATRIELDLEEGNAKRAFLETRCFHIVKSSESGVKALVLPTAKILSCARKEVEGKHQEVLFSETALQSLKEDANSLRPRLFADSAPSHTPSGPVQSCRVHHNLRACLNARCTWTNGRCDPTIP
jgi:pimeloyl-ACP methyl ester carboxylesterase